MFSQVCVILSVHRGVCIPAFNGAGGVYPSIQWGGCVCVCIPACNGAGGVRLGRCLPAVPGMHSCKFI